MSKITLTIDEHTVEVDQGTTILDAARAMGIEIPTLCYHPNLSLHGSCRVCVVEDVRTKRLLASCVTEAQEGMVISTRSSRARRARRRNVELLLANHPQDCLSCYRNGSCELQEITYKVGVTREDVERLRGEKRDLPMEEVGPALRRELNKCILCGR
ncbi:2Fe-2S iron-sulfur cluster-binding protein, partial [Candidatus Darwinibacter acetoxidans]